DGRLPRDEDEPGSNVFFRAGSSGGRFRMDFGSALDIAQVNTYSCHPNSRGPQLYKLYAADGSKPKLNLDPKRGVDPASCGWKFIALGRTLSAGGTMGGQYAASVNDLGKHRYLLFDVYVTELYDNWGNTFYTELDVIRKSSAVIRGSLHTRKSGLHALTCARYHPTPLISNTSETPQPRIKSTTLLN